MEGSRLHGRRPRRLIEEHVYRRRAACTRARRCSTTASPPASTCPRSGVAHRRVERPRGPVRREGGRRGPAAPGDPRDRQRHLRRGRRAARPSCRSPRRGCSLLSREKAADARAAGREAPVLTLPPASTYHAPAHARRSARACSRRGTRARAMHRRRHRRASQHEARPLRRPSTWSRSRSIDELAACSLERTASCDIGALVHARRARPRRRACAPALARRSRGGEHVAGPQQRADGHARRQPLPRHALPLLQPDATSGARRSATA